LEEVKITSENVMNFSNVVFVFESTSPHTISPLLLEGPYKSLRYMYRRDRVLMLTPYKMRDHQHINKGRKNTREGNKRRKKKDPSPNKRSYLKVQTSQWGALQGENTLNLRPEPITTSTKQVITMKWVKNLEGHQA
jgi:hypothetical protein